MAEQLMRASLDSTDAWVSDLDLSSIYRRFSMTKQLGLTRTLKTGIRLAVKGCFFRERLKGSFIIYCFFVGFCTM